MSKAASPQPGPVPAGQWVSWSGPPNTAGVEGPQLNIGTTGWHPHKTALFSGKCSHRALPYHGHDFFRSKLKSLQGWDCSSSDCHQLRHVRTILCSPTCQELMLSDAFSSLHIALTNAFCSQRTCCKAASGLCKGGAWRVDRSHSEQPASSCALKKVPVVATDKDDLQPMRCGHASRADITCFSVRVQP